MEEIFQLVVEELTRVGKTHLPGGYVLTGGSMAIPGQLIWLENLSSAC